METMRERFAAVTSGLLAEHPRLAVVLADITADSFEPARKRYPDRVINLGIREQLLISVTGGLALAGMRPVAHTFASFLVERPFEQIKLDLNHQGAGRGAGQRRARPTTIADNGRTHQSPGDVALLGTLPGWTVHVPGHPDEAERQLRAAATGQDLVYLRLSTTANTVPLAAAPGRLTVLRTGRRGTVLAVGPLADAGAGRHPGPRRDRAVRGHHPAAGRGDAARHAGGAGRGAGRAVPGRHLGAGRVGRAAGHPAPDPRARRRPRPSCAGTAPRRSIRPRTAWTRGRCARRSLVPGG